MAVEAVASSVTSGLGGVGGAGPADAARFDPAIGSPAAEQASTPPVRQASLEARTAGAETAARRGPAAEVQAAPHRTGDSMGHRVLDGIDRVQKGDTAWRTRAGDVVRTADDPVLKVGARPPGPAESALRPDAYRGPEIAGHSTTQPGKSDNPGFDGMLRQLEQVSGQVVQASLVTKTTSSFTGSLNKLLSSG